MKVQIYKKLIFYLKSSGTCILFIGSCWFLYQVRKTSQILGSAVPTNVLNLEQKHAQYIYIDHPRFKDVSMFRENDTSQHSAVQTTYSFSQILMKWWKSLNRTLAYRLLHMAQHGDKVERTKAIYTLSSLKYLKDWHYRHIAQVLDAKTAVALARMPNVDSRFFLAPPYYHLQYKLYDVIEKVHNLLRHLSTLCNNTHLCLTQFLNKKFKDSHPDGLIFDHDLSSVGLSPAPAITWDRELLESCVQILCHHSSLEEYSKDIVDAGGLLILMVIKKMCENDINICIQLAKIMSNLSVHTQYLEHIFRSGWIGTLVQWSHSNEIRLSVPAAQALSNLDVNECERVKYPRYICLLHPLYKTRIATKLDVIFLHGLRGGVFKTWRQRDLDTTTIGVVDSDMIHQDNTTISTIVDDQPQEFLRDLARDLKMLEWNKVGEDFEVVFDDCPENINCRGYGPYSCSGDDDCVKKSEHDRRYRTQCWPKDWLPDDITSLRVIGVNYDTYLSMWTPLCPIEGTKTTIAQRSELYGNRLLKAGVGLKPIVWVGHSMGGLLIKRILVDEWKNGDKNDVCKNTRGIIFYSTPHRGSPMAVLKQTTQMLVWPSDEVQELREESPPLLDLHEDFLNMLKEYPMEIISFCETKSTPVTALKLPYQFVTPKSADPGVGEFFEIPQDHLTICKPASRQSFLYQRLVNMLKRHVNSPEETKPTPILQILSFSSKLF